jgi:hypothetical protein
MRDEELGIAGSKIDKTNHLELKDRGTRGASRRIPGTRG